MALTPINLGAAPNDGKGDNLRTAGSKINDNFAALDAKIDGVSVTASDGYIFATDYGYRASNNQSHGADNYTAIHRALLLGSAQGRLVALPPGTGYINHRFRYENDNYRGTGIIGLGARGGCIIKLTNTLSTGNGWIFDLSSSGNSHPYNFTLINLALDGNRDNLSENSSGIRMDAGGAERVWVEDVDTYNFTQSGRQFMGGLTEGAVVDKNGRAWNCDMHGFVTRGSLSNFGTAVVFENPVAWATFQYPIDISRGRAIIRGTADFRGNTSSGSGNMKMSSDGGSNYADSVIADTIIMRATEGVGFRTTGDPPGRLEVKRWEIGGIKADVALRTKALKQVKIGTLILRANEQRDILSEGEWIEIDTLEIYDASHGDGGSTHEAIRFEGPLRYLRIGRLIAHNNRGRVLAVAPSSGVPTPATIVEIDHMELVDNNRDHNSSHRIVELRSSSHPVHMRIRDGIAYDTRGTPRQTQIFSAIASGGRAARINIDRFVFGAGAQSGNRFSTSGTGASITVGESIGV